MKKILLLSLMMVLLLTACGVLAREVEETPPKEAPQEETASKPGVGLSLEMEHEVYDPSVEQFTYFLHNGTEETVEFGEDYAIQRWEDGQWQDLTLRENAGWNAIGYALEPGGTSALICGFGLYQEEPETGTYRLVKQVGKETLYASFELGDSPYTAETPHGFGPLEDLPLDYGAASAAEEDVVFTGDGVKNDGAVEEFLYQVSLDTSCQLRTVQDYGEGAPMVIDVIYENDHFLWRMWSGGAVTEKRFSYIVTDGADLYLSNGADWENTLAYDSDKVFLVPERTVTWLVSTVEEMTANRLEWNVTRYKVWSAENDEGVWSAGLRDGIGIPDPATEFFVEWHSNGGGGRGSSYNLQNWDGLETAIRKIAWQENGTLRLTCDTVAGGVSVLYFDPENESFR